MSINLYICYFLALHKYCISSWKLKLELKSNLIRVHDIDPHLKRNTQFERFCLHFIIDLQGRLDDADRGDGESADLVKSILKVSWPFNSDVSVVLGVWDWTKGLEKELLGVGVFLV